MTVRSTWKLLGPISAATLVLAGPQVAEATTIHPAHHGVPGASPLATPGAPTRSSDVVQQSGASSGEIQDVLDYWTSERMETARPLDRLFDESFPVSTPHQEDQAGPPTSGTDQSRNNAGDSTGDRWTAGGVVTRTTGRVFLTMGGRDFTCSAAVVPAENRDTVVTAGHCLKDGTGAWADNWTFVPGYDSGEEPYGRYAAREMLVDPKWSSEVDDNFDFGMAVLHPLDGTDVQDRVGAQRIDFSDSSGQQTHAFGYPATGGYYGNGLHYCSGRSTTDRRGTTANGIPCDMTEGSSGGPWLTDFDTDTGKGTITSVISFKYADDPSTQFGPRFGQEARKLYEKASTL